MSHENDASRSDLALLIARRAQEHGPRCFLQDIRSGRMVTYAGLGLQCGRCRTALDAAAVAPGARVLIDIADPTLFSVAYLGVIAAGRCAVPVDPDAPAGERERVVATVAPSAVIDDHSHRTIGSGLTVVPVPDLGAPADPRDAGEERAGPTHPGCVLLLTSGSTGAPKAVMLTEGRLLHTARAVAAHNRLTAEDRGFNPLPLFHINAEVVALLATLTAGATLLLDRRFHRHGFWEALAERDVTWINLVPAILAILAEHPVPVTPPRLRFIRSASAPLPDAVRSQIETVTGAPVVESYGMTEAASQITAMPLDGGGPTGSCGRAVGAEVEIRGTDERLQPSGTIGRIWIRGPGVIDRYDGDRSPERFDAAGWLDTGDNGFLDADGYLFLVGRSDDVINRGGELLYPREIEEVLIADSGVRDAIVVGHPDPILGQVPVAYITPVAGSGTLKSPGAAALIERLSARCAAQLSRFKLPQAIYAVDSLPRTPNGKIQRRALPAGGPGGGAVT